MASEAKLLGAWRFLARATAEGGRSVDGAAAKVHPICQSTINNQQPPEQKI